MSEEDQKLYATEGIKDIIEICKLYKIDYFSLSKSSQALFIDIYIAGARFSANKMMEAYTKAEKEYERPNI